MSRKLASTYERALKSQPNSNPEMTELVINLGKFDSKYLRNIHNRIEKKIKAKLLTIDQIKKKEKKIGTLFAFEKFYLRRISNNEQLINKIEGNKSVIDLRNDFLSSNPKKLQMEDVGLEYENSFNWLVDNWKEYSLDFIKMTHSVRKKILDSYRSVMSLKEIQNLEIGNSIIFKGTVASAQTLEKQTSAVFTKRQNIFTVKLPKREKITINEVILEMNGTGIDEIDKLVIGYVDKNNHFVGIYSTIDSGANTMAITYPPPMADAMNQNPLNNVNEIIYKVETETQNKINVNQVKFLVKFNEE